jgi:hypothetical protein
VWCHCCCTTSVHAGHGQHSDMCGWSICTAPLAVGMSVRARPWRPELDSRAPHQLASPGQQGICHLILLQQQHPARGAITAACRCLPLAVRAAAEAVCLPCFAPTVPACPPRSPPPPSPPPTPPPVPPPAPDAGTATFLYNATNVLYEFNSEYVTKDLAIGNCTLRGGFLASFTSGTQQVSKPASLAGTCQAGPHHCCVGKSLQLWAAPGCSVTVPDACMLYGARHT